MASMWLKKKMSVSVPGKNLHSVGKINKHLESSERDLPACV